MNLVCRLFPAHILSGLNYPVSLCEPPLQNLKGNLATAPAGGNVGRQCGRGGAGFLAALETDLPT